MKNIFSKSLLASILGASLLALTGTASADAWVQPGYHHDYHRGYGYHHYKQCYWVWRNHHRVKECRWVRR